MLLCIFFCLFLRILCILKILCIFIEIQKNWRGFFFISFIAWFPMPRQRSWCTTTYIRHISLLFYHKTRLESLPILDSLYAKCVIYDLVSCSSSTEIFAQSWCTIPALVFVLILKWRSSLQNQLLSILSWKAHMLLHCCKICKICKICKTCNTV